jgi:CheY-like chemotaxis protein
MKLRILLIEDDRQQRITYMSRLQADGYYVAFASSAVKAIDMLLHEEPFDLVLLDYDLDGSLSGLEVSGYIQNAAERTGIPPPTIFLLTGHTKEVLAYKTKVRNPLQGISFFFFKSEDDFEQLWRAISIIARNVEDEKRTGIHSPEVERSPSEDPFKSTVRRSEPPGTGSK